MRKPLVVVAAIVLFGTAAGLYILANRSKPTPQTSVNATRPSNNALPPVFPANPLSPAPSTQHLPGLADSDELINNEISDLLGSTQVADYINSGNLVRRIVATVDNLPRRKLNAELSPVRGPKSAFIVTGDDDRATLSESSYVRYEPFIAIVRTVDVAMVSEVYTRTYPLFQQAYEDLGYPQGYLNDRLVAAIDNLLATPESPANIDLIRSNVFYEFLDPQLESLSAGQKILLRIGPANRRVVEQKLIDFRRLIARVQQVGG